MMVRRGGHTNYLPPRTHWCDYQRLMIVAHRLMLFTLTSVRSDRGERGGGGPRGGRFLLRCGTRTPHLDRRRRQEEKSAQGEVTPFVIASTPPFTCSAVWCDPPLIPFLPTVCCRCGGMLDHRSSCSVSCFLNSNRTERDSMHIDVLECGHSSRLILPSPATRCPLFLTILQVKPALAKPLC